MYYKQTDRQTYVHARGHPSFNVDDFRTVCVVCVQGYVSSHYYEDGERYRDQFSTLTELRRVRIYQDILAVSRPDNLYTSSSFNGLCSGTTRVGRYQKKTSVLLDFYGAGEDNGGTEAPTIRMGAIPTGLTAPPPTIPQGFFTGRIPLLPPNQQRQSTEGTYIHTYIHKKFLKWPK